MEIHHDKLAVNSRVYLVMLISEDSLVLGYL